MGVGTEYIPAIAVAAGLAAPFLAEAAKRRFGREERAERAGHERHAELIAELDASRSECESLRGDLAAERGAQKREIALLRQLAGQQMLIEQLTGRLPELTGGSLPPRLSGPQPDGRGDE